MEPYQSLPDKDRIPNNLVAKSELRTTYNYNYFCQNIFQVKQKAITSFDALAQSHKTLATEWWIICIPYANIEEISLHEILSSENNTNFSA